MIQSLKGRDTYPALIVTDLDGTFLSDDKSLSQENIQAIKSLRNSGIPVFFCTGRPFSFVEKYVKLSEASSLVIGGNGSVIKDVYARESIFQRCFDPTTQEKLLRFCLEQEIDTLAYPPNGNVYFSKNSERVQVFRDYNDSLQDNSVSKVNLLPLESLNEGAASESVYKILASKKTARQGKNDLQRLSEFLKTMPAVYAVPSMEGVIDMMPQGVSKGAAVAYLAEYLNVSLDRVGVVGDNKNDISMFKTAGKSVCMANGDDEAKHFADWVTNCTNNEAGFAEAVKWLEEALHLNQKKEQNIC